jgi:phage FluMu protein Com
MSDNTVTAKQADKKKFPTEFIDLPSKGWFYPETHPLASGQVELKYMTAREEDILTSANLIKKGKVIDTLINALLVTDVTYDDILVGDKNAIMIAARILGYGKDYNIDYTCPKCGEINKLTIDLTGLENKKIDFKTFTKHSNEFEFELPLSKTTITFKLMTGGSEKTLESEMKGLAKFASKDGPSKALTTRLKHQILAINGNRDTKVVREYIDNELFAQDSLALRNFMREASPDVLTKFNFECESCTHTETVDMPIDAGFFWPSSES